jgi:hypothetical protein
MSRTGNEVEVLPKFNDEGNLNSNEEVPLSDTSTGPSLVDLMTRLEMLMVESKRLRAKVKGKKAKESTFSSEEEDSSFEEEVSKKTKKGRRNCNKPSYNAMSFNYNNMPCSTAYTFIPVGKAPQFDGTNYNQWKHCMKTIYILSHLRYGKLFVMV